jgi:hypothetical protein
MNANLAAGAGPVGEFRGAVRTRPAPADKSRCRFCRIASARGFGKISDVRHRPRFLPRGAGRRDLGRHADWFEGLGKGFGSRQTRPSTPENRARAGAGFGLGAALPTPALISRVVAARFVSRVNLRSRLPRCGECSHGCFVGGFLGRSRFVPAPASRMHRALRRMRMMHAPLVSAVRRGARTKSASAFARAQEPKNGTFSR